MVCDDFVRMCILGNSWSGMCRSGCKITALDNDLGGRRCRRWMVRVQAGGIARLIKDKEPKLVIKVVPGGGLVNPVRVSMHKDDLGWGITFVDKMAI